MPFWDYRQNNSGGSFDVDEKSGIDVTVIIEADTVDQANERAEGIGLYWDGVENNRDCDCCGDRWSRVDGPGDPVPSMYGTPISSVKETHYRNPSKTFIHFSNGTFVRAHDFVEPVLRDLAKELKDAPDF